MSAKAPGPKYRSVSDIKSSLMHPALTSHYEVYIAPPADESFRKFFNPQNQAPELNAQLTDLLMLSCSDASLPGSTLATHELNNDFTGVTQRHAYRRLYDDRADFTFYVNQEYTQIRFFETWMRFISGEQISGSESLNISYRVKYPNKYKSTIYITKFERNVGKVGKNGTTTQNNNKSKKMIYSFFNAFPISVNSMPVSYEFSQLLEITVSFTYDRYVASNASLVGTITEPGQSTANSNPNSPFDITSYWNPPNNSTTFDYSSGFPVNAFNLSSGTLTNSFGEGDEIINSINSLQTPVESGLPYVGRNEGPISYFSGL